MTTLGTGKNLPQKMPSDLKRRAGLLWIHGVLAVGCVLPAAFPNGTADHGQENSGSVQAVSKCQTCHWYGD
ncbi:hypothetical protein ABZ208_24710 [Streptomyces sp. NPDC006208]|uniref:hypothetical protein n=1 Tax=Streptomyces sp. NPDC006208 TaxID=3156734 RepID=UPI0033AC1786